MTLSAGISFTIGPTYYVNPDYAAQVAKAEASNAFYFAYHFLTNEDPTAQAKYCFDNVGSKVAVMADVETQTQTGSKPTLEQNVEFIQAFRNLGGIIHVNYLPQWYWSSVWGSADLAPLKNLDMVLVSSNYSGYSTNGGWPPTAAGPPRSGSTATLSRCTALPSTSTSSSDPAQRTSRRWLTSSSRS